MSEARKNIRKSVVAILKRAKTYAGDNVEANRVRPVWDERLPAISVICFDETVDAENSSAAPREYKRLLAMQVEIHAKADTSEKLADLLDDIAERVENSLFADDTLGGTAANLHLEGSNAAVEPEGGEQGIGSLTLNFTVEYYTYRPSDRFNQKIDDFNTAGVTYQMSDDEDVDTADDLITVNP